ncbi:rod shape-determining protein RodA [Cyclobacteriaceae bacterium]|nr:rod shape-determining protein RodA [Cyclobacteriaceae bacterium]MDB4314625.1 rod shape-determining protein RodA [Cyclobacteriaceae bacterium]MDB4603674.1 rod shape-determining protein RodA [Cyclobacteriaceae bacterium]
MRSQNRYQIDTLSVVYFLSLVVLGWINIYAADYDLDRTASFFDLNQSATKQLIWIGASFLLIAVIFILDYRFYDSFGYVIWGVSIFFLLAVLFFGKEVAGSTSWFEIGFIKIQPSEFAKIATAIGLAKYLSSQNVGGSDMRKLGISTLLFLIPMGLIIMQGDLGSAMVFCSLILVLFREGLSGKLLFFSLYAGILFLLTLLIDQWILLFMVFALFLICLGLFIKNGKALIFILVFAILSCGLIKSVDFVLNQVLKEHQRLRVISLINPNADPLGIGWNVMQSKIAIGSGGFMGKGFLKGTQTKFDFVPAQTTDFIFCTIGEEQGWLGTTLIMTLFGAFFLRLLTIAERQKSRFIRIYGYSVVSIIFFHFAINIAMTIGLFPVIGIPLPFFSYGGSSLWTFTMLLFILLRLDSQRMEQLEH